MEITVGDVDANGWRFRCRQVRGSGEPVLLLHGFPETSRVWEPLMAKLAAEGYRLRGSRSARIQSGCPAAGV